MFKEKAAEKPKIMVILKSRKISICAQLGIKTAIKKVTAYKLSINLFTIIHHHDFDGQTEAESHMLTELSH